MIAVRLLIVKHSSKSIKLRAQKKAARPERVRPEPRHFYGSVELSWKHAE